MSDALATQPAATQLTPDANTDRSVDRPIFICYRQSDGHRHALWIHTALKEALREAGSEREVYFDRTAPASADWMAVHGAALQRAGSFIAVCTPGLFAQQSDEEDWVHREIDWWLANRSTPPIVVDAFGEGNRWVPKTIRDRWPNAQRVNLDRDLWSAADEATQALERRTVATQILAGIAASEASVVHEDLARLKDLNDRLSQTTRRQRRSLVAAVAAAAISVVLLVVNWNARRDLGAVLDIAVTESIDRMVELAQTNLESDPARAVRLAVEARVLDSTRDVRDLVVSALFRNPVWVRLPENAEPDDDGELFPDIFGGRPEFATDRTIKHVLVRPAATDSVALLYDVDRAISIGSLALRRGERIVIDGTHTRSVVVTRRMASLSAAELKFYELTPAGIRVPAAVVDSVALTTCGSGRCVPRVVAACASGGWPCGVARGDGTVLLLSQNSSGTIERQVLGQWRGTKRISIHPQGTALLLLSDDGSGTWVELPAQGKRGQSRHLQLRAGEWYMYEPFPWVRWGPESHQLLLLEAHEPNGRGVLRGATAIAVSAVNARTGQRQLLRTAPWRDTGLGLPVFETDSSGHRFLWPRYDATRGFVTEAMTLDWTPVAGRLVRADVREEGLLFGNLPAGSKISLQAGVVAPNGNFAIVATDVRGTSGTQSGRGQLESWDLTPLGEKSSASPDAALMPLRGRKHVRALAYSVGSDRVAALDAAGIVSVFRVRDSRPPELSIEYRIPETIVRKLKADVDGGSTDGRLWLVSYQERDHRLYDLETGLETALGPLVNGQPILATSSRKDTLVVATKFQLSQIVGGKVIRSQAYEDQGAAATISSHLVAVRSDKRIDLYDRGTLKLVGSIDLVAQPALADAVLSDWSESRGSDFSASLLDQHGADIRTYLLGDDWAVTAWQAQRPSTPGVVSFKPLWRKSLAYAENRNKWYSMRRLFDPDVVFLLAGTNSGEAPVFLQLDGATGAPTTTFSIPAMEEHRMMEVVDLRAVRGHVVACFRYYPERVTIGVWKRGDPIAWNEVAVDVGRNADSFGIREVASDDLLHFAFRAAADSIVLYAARSGRQIWARASYPLSVAPYLVNDGGWKVPNESALNRVVSLVRLGGRDIADSITRVQLDSAERRRLERLLPYAARGPGRER